MCISGKKRTSYNPFGPNSEYVTCFSELPLTFFNCNIQTNLQFTPHVGLYCIPGPLYFAVKFAPIVEHIEATCESTKMLIVEHDNDQIEVHTWETISGWVMTMTSKACSASFSPDSLQASNHQRSCGSPEDPL